MPRNNEEQLNDAVAVKGLMSSLQANAGWQRFCEIVKERIEERDRKLDHPLEAMDAVLQQEYVKGARQAYRHVLDLPNSIIASAEAVIEMIEDSPEEEDYGTQEED